MPGGRPTKYIAEYHNKVGRKLCLLGLTDKQVAETFNVTESTLYLWKQEYPEFSEALNKGKVIADADIAESLYERAKGYDKEEVRADKDGNQLITTTHMPAHPTAQIFWLKNRHPELWREKQEIEHSGDVHMNFDEQDKGLVTPREWE